MTDPQPPSQRLRERIIELVHKHVAHGQKEPLIAELEPALAAQEASPQPEIAQLFKDHSVALEFVRELAAVKCAAECGRCLRCRATKWLHLAARRQEGA